MVSREEFWKEKKVFVTGASGLLGGHLVRELVNLNAEVTVLLRDWNPSSELIKTGLLEKVNIVRGSLADMPTLARALHEYEIDSIFHLGAQTQVTIANQHPIGTFEANIMGTAYLLEAARHCKTVHRIVVASSDKAYGTKLKLPYTEDEGLAGEHPYDVSKSCTDLIAISYFKTYGMPIAVTRCGNLYGPGDLNFNRIVPGTIKSIYLGAEPIIRSDGTFIRDYLYVGDAVDAYLTVAENLHRTDVKGNAFNFSSEERSNVLDMVNAILKLTCSKLKPKILNEAHGEIKNQYLSNEKSRKVLGWEASHKLEKGLAKTIPWYQEFFKERYGSK